MIGAGIAIYVVGTLAKYGLRAYEKMDIEDTEATSDIKINTNPYSSTSREHFETEKSFGLDIGSSHNKVTFRHGIHIDLVENSEGHRHSPSIALVNNDGSITIGHFAKAYKWIKTSNILFGTHLLISSSFLPSSVNQDIIKNLDNSVKIDSIGLAKSVVHDKEYTPQDVYKIFATFLYDITKQKFNQTNSIPTVLSVPVYFSEQSNDLLLHTCRQSGFNCVSVVPDPVNAALGALELNLFTAPSEHNYVLVVDIGGRLVQVSAVCVAQSVQFGQPAVRPALPVLVAHHTVLSLGGDLFTDIIAAHVSDQFARATGINLLSDKQATQQLLQACEGAKHDLSHKHSSRVYVPFITADQQGPRHLDVTLTRPQLEDLLLPRLTAALTEAYREVAEVASQRTEGLRWTAVLLAGGGAKTSCVQTAVGAVLRESPRLPWTGPLLLHRPEDLVSLGAAAAVKYL